MDPLARNTFTFFQHVFQRLDRLMDRFPGFFHGGVRLLTADFSTVGEFLSFLGRLLLHGFSVLWISCPALMVSANYALNSVEDLAEFLENIGSSRSG